MNIRSILTKDANQKSDKKNNTFLMLLDYIANTQSFKTVEIKENIRMDYSGDFHGLLGYISTNPKLNYLNMLLNGLHSSNEYDPVSTSTIYIVDESSSFISQILEKIKNI